MVDQLDSALDLMRRLPPQKIDESLQSVIAVVPLLCADLLAAVDQPLKTAVDQQNGKEYLLCDYNRDGDSYRSPWTNAYDPPLEDGSLPSSKLRKLEIEMNSAIDQYRAMYFDGGVSSVYLWDIDSGFAGAVLIKKGGDAKFAVGCWDSIHVIEVKDRTPIKNSTYKLTSTVMLWLQTQKENSGYFNLGGSLTRAVEKEINTCEGGMTVNASHISNIGRMIEDMENSIRSTLNEVYFSTSRNIVDTMRSITSADEEKKRRALVQEVNNALQNKNNS